MNYKRIEKLAKLYFKTWWLNQEEPKDQVLDILELIKERLEDNKNVKVYEGLPIIYINDIKVMDHKMFKEMYPDPWEVTNYKYKNLSYEMFIIFEHNDFLTSIYNVTGDAWTETHFTLEEAIKELEGDNIEE